MALLFSDARLSVGRKKRNNRINWIPLRQKTRQYLKSNQMKQLFIDFSHSFGGGNDVCEANTKLVVYNNNFTLSD